MRTSQTVREQAHETAQGKPAKAQLEALLERYVAGEDEAFEQLVEAVGGRLFGFIRRYVRDRHRAEDVYQAVLVKVATHAETFDRRARLETWVYRIARNACLDELRRASRDRLRPISGSGEQEDAADPMERMPGNAPAPGEAVTQSELGLRIRAAVEDLPDEQREVFLLKEDGELTFEEIGDMLGCGKETAKSRMRYALGRLRNALGQEARLYGLTEAES